MIFADAGVAQFDPHRFTWREIYWAARGRQVDEWNRTAALMALVHNLNTDRNKTPAANDTTFHPLRGPKTGAGGKVPITADNISILKIFLPPKGGR